MCGIVGRAAWSAAPVDPARAAAALCAVAHRGPDDRGQTTTGGVWLGHTRLTVLDLSCAGHQPLTDRSGRWSLTYNGEVYNYVELRRELVLRGHEFRSTGDTEVVLAALVEWGTAAFRRFNGMWALGLVDRRERTLLLSRDRYGVKPLFQARLGDGSTAFASEPKSLLALDPALAEPDVDACKRFLRHLPGAEAVTSVHRGVEAVPPATARLLRCDGTWTDERFWSPPSGRAPGRARDVRELHEQFRALLTSAVDVRLRSDVQVGTTLSGGVDSTVVSALAAQRSPGRLTAYTAAFPGTPIDESATAAATAERFGLRPAPVRVDVGRLDLDLLTAVVRHLDGPTGSPAVVPTWHVVRAAAQDGTTVLLEGQGADELLGGYPTHVLPAASVAAVWAGQGREAALAARALVRHAGPARSAALMATAAAMRPGVDGVLRRDHRHVLPPLLDYGDRISMAHGVEVRLPFMDHRLVDLVMSLPTSELVGGGRCKVLLRDAFAALLPTPVARGPKRGYPTPVVHWLRVLGPELADLLCDGDAVQRGLVPRGGVRALLLGLRAGAGGPPLFRLLTTELWLRSLRPAR